MKNKSWTIKTALSVNYEIKNSANLFSVENNDLLSYISKRVLVVIDEKVGKLYLNKIVSFFDYHNIQHKIVLLNGVETEKSLDSLLLVLREIEQFGVDRRNEPIVGIGGGVVQDVVGLAATLYRRGIPYIRIPTTLLGIVDVSVAAKTGINFEQRRNRLGSYYPPVISFLDKTFLPTVDSFEISSGMGEILKMAVVKDYSLFEILESHSKMLLDTKFDCEFADDVINKSVKGMIEELENNLWEKDLKRLVDFGHSFSPIIEMRSLDTLSPLAHGQAVTLDVIFSSVISHVRGMLSVKDVNRIITVAKYMGLDVFNESFADPSLILESLSDTVKHRNGNQNLPIPVKIGESIFLNNLTYDEICVAVEKYKEMTK